MRAPSRAVYVAERRGLPTMPGDGSTIYDIEETDWRPRHRAARLRRGIWSASAGRCISGRRGGGISSVIAASFAVRHDFTPDNFIYADRDENRLTF